MSRIGKTTKKYYTETKGMKVSGGQFIKAGQMLTREGNKWKPGLNVTGRMHLTALCDGNVYFSRKRGRYNKEQTLINIKPVEAEKK